MSEENTSRKSITCNFDAESWELLEKAARVRGIDPGTALANAIALYAGISEHQIRGWGVMLCRGSQLQPVVIVPKGTPVTDA